MISGFDDTERHCRPRRNRYLLFDFFAKKGTSFFQLFDVRSFTYTYLLADERSRDAIVIDPVFELVDRDLRIVRDLGLNLKYAGIITFLVREKSTVKFE